MDKLSLSTSIVIPVEKYAPLKPTASVENIQGASETDEELFERTYKDLRKALEAQIALEYSTWKGIQNSGGTVKWARDLFEIENDFIEKVVND